MPQRSVGNGKMMSLVDQIPKNRWDVASLENFDQGFISRSFTSAATPLASTVQATLTGG